MMKLLVENIEAMKVLQEDNGSGEKKTYITGPFMQADILNGNNRVYPSRVMMPAVEKYVESHVNTNRALGELTHPSTHKIDPDRVCIRITELKQDGSNVLGKALITKTPCGDIVKGLLESGVNIGVSSRCLGAMKEDSKTYPGKTVRMVEKMHIITPADVVLDPSAPDAWMQTINEQKEWIMNDYGVIIERDIGPMLQNSVDREVITERRKEAFFKFLSLVGKTG